MTTRKVFIVDIDGTIADCSHRLHYIQNGNHDWTGFFKACVNDTPIWEVIDTIRLLEKSYATIIMVTGRSNEVENETRYWLMDYGIPCHGLYMRKAGDHREDSIVKSELLSQLLEDRNIGLKDIVAVFEDRQHVVDMYRAKGLKVLQVAEGNF